MKSPNYHKFAIWPTPPVSFRSSHVGELHPVTHARVPTKGPLGWRYQKMELTRQQAIDSANRVAENETQEVIIVHRVADSRVSESLGLETQPTTYTT